MMRKAILILIAFAGLSLSPGTLQIDGGMYLSPTHICIDEQSGNSYISLSTAGKIAVVNIRKEKLKKTIDLPFNPGGLALSGNSKTLMATDMEPEGRVHFISLANDMIEKSIRVGHTPDAMAVTPDGKLLFVANRFTNNISVIDIEKRNYIKHIPVVRDPAALAISPDGKSLAVANKLPDSAADEENISAEISLINIISLKVDKNLELANGSQSIVGLAFSRDGRYLYASHIISRNNQPTSQIEHGWINSNAISIIDIKRQKYITSVLLDSYNRGAANPAGMVISDDGSRLIVALSGVHEICTVDLAALHNKLESMDPEEQNKTPYDLSFLQGLKTRKAIIGKSPRYLSLHDKKLLISSYFSTDLLIYPDVGETEKPTSILLGNEPDMDIKRRGELLFCDADLCFQKWQSCISCHPDSRTDGLNWDLLNDGAGNPKNTRSMLFSHFTPPVMITGVRDRAETAVRSGIKYIQFTRYEESDASAIDAYLKSLRPVPSPRLVNGKLNINAKKGKEVFERAGCGKCHSGDYYTDGKQYNVGTGTGPDANTRFDVPTLREVWRTAPYLYDGRARTMMDVFARFNPGDEHGVTSRLSEEELEWLIEYVLSL